LASSVRYLKISTCWIWSTSNQPNSMIWWSWHHFGQKAPLALMITKFTAIQLGKSTARHLPTICIDYLVFCWERRGKIRIRIAGWWMVSTQSAATMAVISASGLWGTQQFAIDIARECFSGNVIQVLAAIDSRFQRLWSNYRVILYICTCIQVSYIYYTCLGGGFKHVFFYFLPNLAEDDPIWTKGGDCPPSCMCACAMRSEVLMVVFRRMISLPT